eukprot:TRINITY_DN1094_c1_g3_i4.p1 TRINITY_DN1094_c1_g3~~TRINITY_DN1094_c1_g3_i4.p1  ORF type:complete len:540 (+),score=42.70 TRINITY_DN1094_c1_g3_i4:518-2137(+)
MVHCSTLPEGIQPIWLEGVLTQEYERDTLPLLFASDDVFQEYYDVLVRATPHMKATLEQIRTVNKRAREQRAEGFWQECLKSLAHCTHLRRSVFDDSDFQYTAAVVHHVLSVYSFASFFLSEARAAPSAQRVGLLSRSFELLKLADSLTAQVRNTTHRAYLRAAIANHLANYFFRRKKPKAAAQQVSLALRHWQRARLSRASNYFLARDASALCFAERWEDAAKALSACARCFANASTDAVADDFQSSKGRPEDEEQATGGSAPVRFDVQLAGNPMSITDAAQIVVSHNHAVSCVGLRRYREAAEWCQRAMDAANRASAHLAASHPWVKAIKSCQVLCTKLSFSQHYSKYKMKPQDLHVPEFVKMQRIINETRTMPVFNDLIELHRQQRMQATEAKQHQEKAKQQYTEELQRKAAENIASRGTTAMFLGKPNWTPHRQRSCSPPSVRRKPLSALRMYLQQTSYKQFVDEYSREHGIDPSEAQYGASTARVPRPPDSARRVPQSAGALAPLKHRGDPETARAASARPRGVTAGAGLAPDP